MRGLGDQDLNTLPAKFNQISPVVTEIDLVVHTYREDKSLSSLISAALKHH